MLHDLRIPMQCFICISLCAQALIEVTLSKVFLLTITNFITMQCFPESSVLPGISNIWAPYNHACE